MDVTGPGEQVHHDAYVVDLHLHGPGFVPPPFRALWRAATVRAPGEIGFDGLQRAGVDVVVACAVGDPVVTRLYLGRSPWQAVETQLALIDRQADQAGAVLALSVDDLGHARRAQRTAVLLGVEGADALGHDVDRVDAWHERGVRLVTFVHLGDNTLGTTSLPWQHYAGPLPVRRPTAPGLSTFGTRVVARMNELGTLVDLAHADRATLLGAVDATTAPLVSSHSGARALQDFPRYLADDELTAIAATGGVVGLWPFRSRRVGVPDQAALVAHARHIADLVGPEHLGLGTDLNGVPAMMADYRGPADLPRLASALCDAGFSAAEVHGILGGNAVRVLTQVQQHARRRASGP